MISFNYLSSAFSSIFNLPNNSAEAFKLESHVLQKTMKGQVWKAGLEDFHRNLLQPFLLIEGENDSFVPLEDALDMLKVIKYAYLVVLDQGSHMIIMEKADIINKLIYLFLNDSFL